MNRASTNPGDPLAATKPATTQRAHTMHNRDGEHRSSLAHASIVDVHRRAPIARLIATLTERLAIEQRCSGAAEELIPNVLR